ncbi:MAG: hypothetical protein FJZ16_03995 [Candidatus Omnitrophica bacterium]|nr:hypothetical protein [Candidatus Omnitrophota bacterium]
MSNSSSQLLKWRKVTAKWIVSILLAVLVVVKLVYDYKIGDMEPLVFWVIIGSISTIYLVILIAVLLPRTAKFLVGKKVYFRPFFAKTPEEAEQYLRDTFKPDMKALIRVAILVLSVSLIILLGTIVINLRTRLR